MYNRLDKVDTKHSNNVSQLSDVQRKQEKFTLNWHIIFRFIKTKMDF